MVWAVGGVVAAILVYVHGDSAAEAGAVMRGAVMRGAAVRGALQREDGALAGVGEDGAGTRVGAAGMGADRE